MDSVNDPVQAAHSALTGHRASAVSPGGSVSVEVSADGRIRAIRLTDRARRASADKLAVTIMQVHNAALDKAHAAATAAIARLEADPRIRSARNDIADLLNDM